MALIIIGLERYPKEAALIGRLMLGYAELEVDMAFFASEVMRDRELVMKTLYRTRGETQRIAIADAMMRPKYRSGPLKTKYEEAIAGLKYCVQVRNQYAHCTWNHDELAGLRFLDFEEYAISNKPWAEATLTAHRVTIKLLEEQEAFFTYVQDLLLHLKNEAERMAGKSPSHVFEAPKKVQQPPKHSPPLG